MAPDFQGRPAVTADAEGQHPAQQTPLTPSSTDRPRTHLVIAVLAVWFVTVLAHRQMFDAIGFDSRDHRDWYIRVLQYAAEWTNLHWPQSLPDAFHGAGHAFPRYYPPFSHWIAGATFVLFPDPILATHLSGIVALLVGSALHIILVRRLTGDVRLAALAGAAYVVFPYTLQQLQARGALAEVWVGAWYPLVMLGALKSADSGRLSLLYPISLALVLVTHMVMALWALPVLFLVVILSRRAPIHAAKQAVLASIIAAGLASFHLASVFMGLGSVRAADPAVMFATAEEVASASGVLGTMPLTLFLLAGLAFVATRFVMTARRTLLGGSPPPLWLLSLIGIVVLMMMFVAPEPLWALVPVQWRYIQFPVRLLSPITYLLILAGVHRLGRLEVRGARLALAVTALLALAWVSGGSPVIRRAFVQEDIRSFMAGDYAGGGFTVAQEYLPRGVAPDSLASAVRQVLSDVGIGPIREWRRDGREPVARIEMKAPGLITLPLVAYDFNSPYLVNGARLRAESNGGLLAVRLDAGRHDVVVGRIIPNPIVGGMIVSIITLFGLVVWAAWTFRRIVSGRMGLG